MNSAPLTRWSFLIWVAGAMTIVGDFFRRVPGSGGAQRWAEIFGLVAWPVLIGLTAAACAHHLSLVTGWRSRLRTVLILAGVAWIATVAIAVLSHRGYLPGPRRLLGTFLPYPGLGAVAGLEEARIAVVATALGALLLSASVLRRHLPRRLLRGAAIPLSPLPLAMAVFGSSAIDLVARQHVEYVDLDPLDGSVIVIDGPVLTTILWVAVTVVALGLVLTPILRTVLAVEASNGGRSDSFRTWMAAIVAGGFVVRLGTLLTVAPTRTDGGDPLFYHVTANLLANGRGFPEPLNYVAFENWIPSALHGPLYPVVLSLTSRLGGVTYFDHKFLSLLIGTGVVALTALVAWMVSGSERRRPAALLAGSLAAIYPNLWLVDGVLFPEGLMALLTTAVIAVAYRWWSEPTYLLAVALGVLIAASALTRGEGLMLAGILVVPWFLAHRDLPLRRRFVHIGATALACIVVLAPWSLRNARSFDVFVPLSTNGNELFVYANCGDVYEGKFLGFWLFSCQEELRDQGLEPEGDEAEKSLFWRDVGWDHARENLSDLPRVIAARVGRQWDLFRPWQNTEFAPIEGRNKDAARIGLVMYYAMLPAAALGLRNLRRQGRRLLPLVAMVAMVTLTAAYAYGTTRFRVPAEPVLCILAAVGLVPLLQRLRGRWSSDDRHRGREPLRSFALGDRCADASARERRRTVVSWLVVFGSVILALPASFRAVGSSMEEGFMLVFPEMVMNGAVPNVDFLHLYGPGSLYALAGWFHVVGTTIGAERLFGLIQHLGVVSALIVLSRPWGRKVATAVGVVGTIFVLSPIGLQALAWPGALALGLWSLVCALRARGCGNDWRWWTTSGVLAGLALTFRPDLVLALGLAMATVMWRQRRSWAFLAGGAIVGALPMWIHLGRAGFRASWEGMVMDPVVHLRGGRELPRPPSWDHLDGALQVISEKFGPWWSIPHLSASQQLFVWFFVLPTVAVTLVVVAVRIDRSRRERLVLLSSALFGVGLLPQALQRPDSAHFLWVACVSWPLAVIGIIEIFGHRRPRSHPELRLAVGLTSIVGLMMIVAPFYTLRTYADLAVRSLAGDVSVRTVTRGERSFYLGDERPWLASLEVVDALDRLATPGDRLFVGPMDLRQTAYSDVFFYHLFPELVPATYFIEMDPGLANGVTSRLAADVESADWLILTRFWSGWIEPNDSIVFGSDAPNLVVEEKFCLRRSIQFDLVRLYQRCSRGDGIGPYDPPYRPEYDYAVEVLVPVPPRPDGTCTPTCWGRPSESGVEIGIDTSIIQPEGN